MLAQTGVELMSVSGHSSLALVQENIDAVEQERAADAAMDKLDKSANIPEAVANIVLIN